MQTKLNPCKVCGGKASTLYEAYRSKSISTQAYTVYCIGCGKKIVGTTSTKTKAEWNAANPKEGPKCAS